MDGQDRQDGGGGGRDGAGLTPWPPLQHLERGWRARTGGHAWAWIAAYAAMTGGWARSIAPLQKNLPLSAYGPPAAAERRPH